MTSPQRWALAFLVVALAALAVGMPQMLLDHSANLQGQVILQDKGPAAGATVRWQADSHAVITDSAGRFSLFFQDHKHLTASKPGYFITGARPKHRDALRMMLSPLPTEDNENYTWVDPTPWAGDGRRCGNCHGEIYREWTAGGHARSATGRHFRNLYEGTDWQGKQAGWGLVADHPDGAGVCGSCHAPSLSQGDPARFDLRQIKGVAAQGVHCDYCHKITAVGEGEMGLSHGSFKLRLLRPTAGQLFFGPLDDVDRGEDSFSPLYQKSEYCASCHEGVVFGVPVYTTWSEWLESPACRQGKQCQDCHMRPTGRLSNLAPGRGGLDRDPKTLANHRFFAGSQEEMLRGALSVTPKVKSGEKGTLLVVDLAAHNVGHRLPTGFIDRHLILYVLAADEKGQLVKPLQGPLLPAAVGKELAGQPGHLFAKWLADPEGRQPIPFWRFAKETTDTRLFPDRNETFLFHFPASLRQLRIQLIYRRFWLEVTRDKGWPDEDFIVQERKIIISQADKFTQEERPAPY